MIFPWVAAGSADMALLATKYWELVTDGVCITPSVVHEVAIVCSRPEDITSEAELSAGLLVLFLSNGILL